MVGHYWVFSFFQITSGVFLSIFYNSTTILAFESITILIDDVHFGSIIRYIHINRASMVMALLFFHL